MQRFNHAIILGGGFTGMLAAYVLSPLFPAITVIERDKPAERNGIPQADHLHVLMLQGQKLLNQLIPGIFNTMCQSQLEEIDWANDTRWYSPFGCFPQYSSAIRTLTFSRRHLDNVMHAMLLTRRNVRIVCGRVREILGDSGSVRAVKFIDSCHHIAFLSGDLIIEARGRFAAADDVLRHLGLNPHAPCIIKNELGYASRIYQRSSPAIFHFKQIYLQVRAGINTRGVVISPIENNAMIVTALGLGNDKPPRNEQAFEAFLKQLPNTDLQKLIASLKPVTDIKLYRNLHNCHYHFGSMRQWPSGYVVLGDAACFLNPVYGQGMTLAARQVNLLLDTLVKNPAFQWEQAFQRKIDKQNFMPWIMATSEDQRALPMSARPLNLRCIHVYLDRVLKLAATEKDVHETFISILHMIKNPLALIRPRFMMRVLLNRKI